MLSSIGRHPTITSDVARWLTFLRTGKISSKLLQPLNQISACKGNELFLLFSRNRKPLAQKNTFKMLPKISGPRAKQKILQILRFSVQCTLMACTTCLVMYNFDGLHNLFGYVTSSLDRQSPCQQTADPVMLGFHWTPKIFSQLILSSLQRVLSNLLRSFLNFDFLGLPPTGKVRYAEVPSSWLFPSNYRESSL